MRLKKFELAIILIAINLLFGYYFVLGPIEQSFFGEPSQVQGPISWILWTLWLSLLIVSIIIFLKYKPRLDPSGLTNEIIAAILKDEQKQGREGHSGDRIRKLLSKTHPGIQKTTIYRLLKKMISEGSLKMKSGKYYLP